MTARSNEASTRMNLDAAQPVIVIDDELEFAEHVAAVLHQHGVKAVVPRTTDEVWSSLKVPSRGLIVDARLRTEDTIKIDSVDVVRRYDELHPDRPVMWVSNFFGLDGMHDIVSSRVSPTVRIRKIGKSEITTELVFEWINEQLMASIFQTETPSNSVPPISKKVRQLLSELDLMSWDRMEIKDQDKVFDKLIVGVEEKVRYLFEQTEAEWLVLGGPEGDVLLWGTSTGPSTEELNSVRAEEEVVPFVFHREVELDNITWPGSERNSLYPSLNARFGSESSQVEELLFDTGADANYVDLELLAESGVSIPRIAAQTFPHNGIHVKFRQANTEVVIADRQGEIRGQTSVRAVSAWFRSIGRRKSHRGILSCVLLVDLGMSVVLDGINRVTSIAVDE